MDHIETLEAMKHGMVPDIEALAALDAAIKALRAVREAPVAIMDTREFLSLCAPTEDDFPALYALQGQRVRIVKEAGE